MTEKEYRTLPQNDLDLNLMLTDSVWGKDDVPAELRDNLSEYFKGLDKDGNEQIFAKSEWGNLGFYTRDVRLGNLSTFNNELEACRFMLDLSNDLLNVGMKKPFIIALSRAATILETSQSKSGFLRRIMNTLRQEHYSQQIEPPKKGFFGGKKTDNGGLQ